MNTHTLTEIPCVFDLASLGKALRVRPNSPDSRDLANLAAEAQTVAKPKALYGAVKVGTHTANQVMLDGIAFDSHILQVNLQQAHVVYPFLVTCGVELGARAAQIEDLIWSYWAEGIKQAALEAAMQALQAHLQQTYSPSATSAMSPGSLEDWPITQQQPLFTLLGDPLGQIGVKLTPSMLMIPNKTVSGILFERDHTFKSCTLCPRANCPGRSAPYDETLYEREYCPAAEKEQ